MVPLLLGGLALFGVGAYLSEQEQKNINYEMQLWNNGYCYQCGRRWKYRVFYRRGGYQATALDCHRCRIHEELDYINITNSRR